MLSFWRPPNRPETLDKALLRPGRFDRRIPVELPDLKGREAILKVHAENVKMEGGIDFGTIARATSGASGAELANIINEAALRAVRMGHNRVKQEDLMESVEVILAGYQRKGAVISPEEKKIPRGRTCIGCGKAEKFRSRAEDYDYSQNQRCAGLYLAGG